MLCLRAAQVYPGDHVAKKNETRVALPQPYLAYLKSMADPKRDTMQLKVHLIDRETDHGRQGDGLPVIRHAACGERIDFMNLVPYETPLPRSELAGRVHACLGCCQRHPAHFDLIPRTL